MPDADAREEIQTPARAKKATAPSVEHELQLYYWMKLIRAFEDRVARLSRQNKIFGGVYSGAGQEAIVTASARHCSRAISSRRCIAISASS